MIGMIGFILVGILLSAIYVLISGAVEVQCYINVVGSTIKILLIVGFQSDF